MVLTGVDPAHTLSVDAERRASCEYEAVGADGERVCRGIPVQALLGSEIRQTPVPLFDLSSLMLGKRFMRWKNLPVY